MTPSALAPHKHRSACCTRWPLRQEWIQPRVLGRMLALGLSSGRVMLVDEATGEVRWAVQAQPYHFLVVMSADTGKFVASVATGASLLRAATTAPARCSSNPPTLQPLTLPRSTPSTLQTPDPLTPRCKVRDSSTGALLRTINAVEDGGVESVAWGDFPPSPKPQTPNPKHETRTRNPKPQTRKPKP